MIRYRAPEPNFTDAFDTFLGNRYHNEHAHASIIACGPMVPEAMRAAWLLKEEYGIEVRVLNVHTVKPLDITTIVRAAEETHVVVTVEEHQVDFIALGLGEPAAVKQAASIKCSRCGTNIPVTEYAKDFPMPSDEICSECDYRSYELCTACRIEWGKITQNCDYVCLACRAKPVLR